MTILPQLNPKVQYSLVLDDVLDWAAGYTGPKFHCIFADPPYHLTSIHKRFSKPGSAPAKGGVYKRSSAGFMGASWDGTDEQGNGIAFNPDTWAALSQHLHPGGFIVAFAGTRGYHRMACAMEDSGLVLHPALIWVALSGFPKATRIDTQIDRAAGVEGEIIQNQEPARRRSMDFGMTQGGALEYQPATPLAQTWAGHRYGLQALKPALEFIAVAQVPYSGRPVDCITRTGAGAFNIDAARIAAPDGITSGGKPTGNNNPCYMSKDNDPRLERSEEHPLGRWPANLLLDEAGSALLDAQSGVLKSGTLKGEYKGTNKETVCYGEYGFSEKNFEANEGGASRMFFQSNWQYEILEQLENADPLRYEPKVSSTEGAAGTEGFYWAITPKGFERVTYEEWQALDPKKRAEGNIHPTKKPISLAKYICELISPPDAYAPRRLLVPFAGSGSEMAGAILSGGFEEIVGIDSNPNYHEISKARLAWWSQWPGWGQTDVDKILDSLANEKPAEQLALFQEVAA